MYFYRFYFLVAFASFVLLSEIVAQKAPADNQLLINGRIWRYMHQGISGHPFLFTNQFLEGSVNIGGERFNHQKIRYDIYSDEVMISLDSTLLQLNKERVDSFSIVWQNNTMQFVRIPEQSAYPFSGYVEKLHSGKSKLYIKYGKKIDKPGMMNVPDNFFQVRQIYFVNNGTTYVIKNKGDLLRILKREKSQIHAFLKQNNLRISRNDPVSFVPVLRFHDQISVK